MKTKHPNLPQHIIKLSKNFYKDTKTGYLIHKNILHKYCMRNDGVLGNDIEEVKQHWTYKYDNY